MTAEYQMQALMAMLQGGVGDAYAVMPPLPTAHGRGSEIYTGVANPVTFTEQLRQVAAPLVGQLMGMSNPMVMPTAGNGVGVGEAWYMARRNTQQWQQVQQMGSKYLGHGLAHDAGAIASNLGVPELMGMGQDEFMKLAEKGAGSGIGSMLAQMAASSAALQQLMGGDPLAPYKTMFHNRQLFGAGMGMPEHPLDMESQTQVSQVAADIATELSQAIRGTPNGGIGALPNLQYTRGFKDQDVAGLAVDMQQAGRFGDIGGRMRTMDQASDEYRDEAQAVAVQTGKAIKAFEALGDLMGDHSDMGKLKEAMSKFTQGNWETMDLDDVTASLRKMQGLAQTLNKSKDEMMATVDTVQSAMSGAIGMTPQRMAMGLSGGAYNSLQAGVDMAERVYAISEATGARRPQDIARITAQQTALHAISMQSSAGKALQVLEYQKQEGLVDDDKYEAIRQNLVSGDSALRTKGVGDIATLLGGSEARGREMMRDDRVMETIRAGTLEPARQRAMAGMQQGRNMEWHQTVKDAGIRRMTEVLGDYKKRVGLPNATDPNVAAAGKKEAMLDHLRQLSPSGAGVAEAEYQKVIDKGGTPAQAFSAMQSRLRGMKDMLPPGALESTMAVGAAAQNEMDYAALGAKGDAANTANTILKGLAQTGVTANLNDEQRKRYDDLVKLSRTDPVKAAEEAKAFVNSDAVTSAQREMIQTSLAASQKAQSEYSERVTMERDAYKRVEQGIDANLTMDQVITGNDRLTSMLADLDTGLRKGGGDADKAKAKFKKELENDESLVKMLSKDDKARLTGIGSAEDSAKALKRQKQMNLGGTFTRMLAEGSLGLPADYAKGVRDSMKSGATLKSVQALGMDMGIYNQTMADMDPAARATVGQMALAFGEGTVGFGAVLGIADGDVATTDPKLAKRVKAQADRTGYKDFSETFKSANAEDTKLNQKLTDLQQESAKPEALKEQRRRFEALRPTDEKAYAEFKAQAVAAGVDSDAMAVFDKKFELNQSRAKTSAAFRDKLKTDKDQGLGKDVEIANKAVRRRDAVARDDAMTELGRRKYKDGTAFIADIYAQDYDNMSKEDKAKFNKAISTLTGHGKAWTKGGRKADITAVSRKIATDEQLSTLSTEQMGAVAEISKLGRKAKQEVGGKGGNRMELSGVLTLLETGKPPRNVNASMEGY